VRRESHAQFYERPVASAGLLTQGPLVDRAGGAAIVPFCAIGYALTLIALLTIRKHPDQLASLKLNG
jgi:hypothetical protein